jgi:hypothetical protein
VEPIAYIALYGTLYAASIAGTTTSVAVLALLPPLPGLKIALLHLAHACA